MPKTKIHIIKTLCFDVEVADEATAAAFSEELRKIDFELLLNKVLKKYDPLEEIILFDRVELDIGNIALDEMEAIGIEISRQLEVFLNQQLAAKIERIEVSPNAEEMLFQKNSSTESDIELLIHYLKTGSLPWNIVDSPDMEEILLKLIQSDAKIDLHALASEIKNSIVIERLSTVFNYSTVEILLRKLLDDEVARESENFAAMILEHMSFSQIKNVKKALASIYLSFVNNANQQNKNYTEAFIVLLQPLLGRLTIQALKVIQDKMRILQSLLPDSPLNYLYGNVTGIITQLLREKEISEGEAEDRFPNTLQNPGDESEIAKPESIPDDHIFEPGVNLQEAADEQQDYFLDNSGLVLLNWALIQNNLEELGWVKERKITDEQSRNKILIWMDYLVWGQRRLHEYSLTLNKVLLGMHPADIADIHESISAREKKAAEVLLNAVIENWSVLKSTSIDGLRTSFVQRNGRLSNEDGGWQMHVESKGLDILIDSLPWTYSIIKTPWMEKPLFTQWSTKA